jgi:DNA-binding transcriptional regulator YiaG
MSKVRPKQGARLVALRKAAGLSQTELALAIDVPQQTVACWETCDKAPRSDVLPKMAKKP